MRLERGAKALESAELVCSLAGLGSEALPLSSRSSEEMGVCGLLVQYSEGLTSVVYH